jgi:hypothetical protein
VRAWHTAIPLLILTSCFFDRSGLEADPLPEAAPPGDAAARDAVADGPSGDVDVRTDGRKPSVWAYRKRITVDAKMVKGPLSDFPLLVLIRGDAELAAGARPDGRDLSFRSIDGSQRHPHEVESYDGAGGTLVAWVKVPALSPSAGAELYLYYGNPSPPNPPPLSQVWSSGYAGVWHLTGTMVRDSSASKHAASVAGAVAEVAGVIGSGRRFDGKSTTWITLGDGPLQSNAPFTIELWFHPSKAQSSWIGLATKGRATDKEWVGLYLKPDKLLSLGWSWKPPGAGNMDSTATKPAAKEWHHAAATFDGTLARLYYNGLLDGNSPKGQGYNKLDGPLTLGTDRFDGNPSLDGVIDEVRLSTVERSVEWIATQYANQSDPTTHVKIGKQEAL